jgi:His/Glu/Gln/Arg/opine family amino acid ABC transporter permease subunit
MTFDVGYAMRALPALLRGAAVTIEVAVLAVLLGLVVGVALTVLRASGIRVLGSLAALHISLARGTPLFIQILVVYYALPAIGLDVPRFAAGVVALSLNGGAYIAEMIRGGLSAIPRGQIDAARAVGMKSSLVWRHIRFPQVFVLILPPLTVEFAALLKASSLLSVIAVVELTRTAQGIISNSFRPVEIWITAGILYFVMCYALTAVTRRFERLAALWRPV